MLSLPSPLHPAVVHFPIVLVVVGAAVAVTAVVTRRWSLSAMAAVLLTLGALGSIVAVQTGDEEGEMASTPATETLLNEHEAWAERTRNAALVAAGLAGAVLFTARRWPTASRAFSVGAAIVSVTAAWCVYETGHRGGALVYRHGAGVMQAGG